uniref:Uncharacterized protein n=1 Tax=Phaeomonas parva TaxID=124430 RepID=A0A7S1TWW8_9STRA|mmetsp:Transcript_21696/g.66417  ORF Transcript_21696/g.66417 Transcript_21696/m.66417 type:complete len:586 (+) Transcript_21696:177-1934(+)
MESPGGDTSGPGEEASPQNRSQTNMTLTPTPIVRRGPASRPRTIQDIDAMIQERRRELEELRYYNRGLLSRSLLDRATRMGIPYDDSGSESASPEHRTTTATAALHHRAVSETRPRRWHYAASPALSGGYGAASSDPIGSRSAALSRKTMTPRRYAGVRPKKAAAMTMTSMAALGASPSDSPLPGSPPPVSPAKSAEGSGSAGKPMRKLFRSGASDAATPPYGNGNANGNGNGATPLSAGEEPLYKELLTMLAKKGDESARVREAEALGRQLTHANAELEKLRGETEELRTATAASHGRCSNLSQEIAEARESMEAEREAYRAQHRLELEKFEAQLAAEEARSRAAEEEALRMAQLAEEQAQELEGEANDKEREARRWEAQAVAVAAERSALLEELEQTKARLAEDRRQATETLARWQDYIKVLQEQNRATVLRHLGAAADDAVKRRAFNIWRGRRGSGAPPPTTAEASAATVAAVGIAVGVQSRADSIEDLQWLKDEHAALRRELGRMRRADTARRNLVLPAKKASPKKAKGAAAVAPASTAAAAAAGPSFLGRLMRTLFWVTLALSLYIAYSETRHEPARVCF